MKNYNMKNCKITNGFFAQRQKINAESTIPNVYARFEETGRFKALKCKNEEPHSHIFWDSDVAKWLEGAAYMLARKEDPQIRAWYEEAVNDIIENQLENGYFNSHFQVYRPTEIFTHHNDHELYCAGHLFEAAVAASEYLHDDRLLAFAEKYVDYITERFIVKQDVGFVCCGHPEIELALCRLYESTKNEKFKTLAQFFIDQRGSENDRAHLTEWYSPTYCQSHAPLREQTEAVGHAVRALYAYTGMANMANISGDEGLKKACEKIFENITTKKMYITGATGSVYQGERFSNAYELNNDHAYAETCASIALVFFADQMFRLTGEVKYAHVIERAIYNGVLSGVSLDGSSFFYVNPLEHSIERIRANDNKHAHENLPISERVKVFQCSCCPPNVCRFFEEIPAYIWYADEKKNELVLAQHISSTLTCPVADVCLESEMPVSGKVKLTVNSHGKNITLKVRKPEWCAVEFENEKDGYLVFTGTFENQIIEIEFPIVLKKVYANPLVSADIGKVALSYGPLILCAEGIDNDFPVWTAQIGSLENAEIIKNADTRYAITAKIPVSVYTPSHSLYAYSAPQLQEKTLTLIPYYAWANRGETDMWVWFLEK